MVLYKYTGRNALRILEELKIKVTPPDQFNDPFECTPTTPRSQKSERFVKRFKEDPEILKEVWLMAHKDGLTRSLTEVKETILNTGWKKRIVFDQDAIEAFTEWDLDTVGIFSWTNGIVCLSAVKNSIPMWAYYADEHRGVVLGFEASKLKFGPGDSESFQPVRYRIKRHALDATIPHKSIEGRLQRKRMVCTKSIDWAHEKEFRKSFELKNLTFDPDHKGWPIPFFLQISSDSIREIIFGCRVNTELEAAIRNEIKRRPTTFRHIQLFRARRHPTRYSFEIVPA